MSAQTGACPTTLLRDALLGEASPAGRREVEAHAAHCPACREEMDRLQLTQAALLSVRDEEPLRRIAFVSDKVLQPRWWQVWRWSAPRATFASAALVAAAIVAHGALTRPATPVVQRASVDREALRRSVAAEVEKQVGERMQLALAAAEQLQEQRTAAVVAARLAAVEKRNELDRQALLVAFEEQVSVLQKTNHRLIRDMRDIAYVADEQGRGQ